MLSLMRAAALTAVSSRLGVPAPAAAWPRRKRLTRVDTR